MASTYLDRVENKALGQMLIEKGALQEEQVTQALQLARERGIRLGEALVELGFIGTDALSYTIAEQYGQRPMELHPSMVDERLLMSFDSAILWRHMMLPLIELETELIVVVADPNDQAGLDALSAAKPDLKIMPQLGAESQIRRCLELVLPGGAPEASATDSTIDLQSPTRFPQLPHTTATEFMEFLWSVAAENSNGEILLRQAENALQMIRALPSEPLEILTEWPRQSLASVLGRILRECRPVPFTNNQAWRMRCRARLNGASYSFAVLTPIIEGPPELRVRATQCHDSYSSRPAHINIPPGEVAIATTDTDTTSTALTLLHSMTPTDRVVLFSRQWMTSPDEAPVYPAPFVDLASAAQGHSARYVLLDYLPRRIDLLRLLAATETPPAILILTNASSATEDSAETIDWPGLRQLNTKDLFEGGQA